GNMEDTDNQCFAINRRNISSNSCGVSLPDIIMDAMPPPPSPLQRAHSYHLLFPIKNNVNSCHEEPVFKQEKQDHKQHKNDTCEEKKWKKAGDDLKKIADKFQLGHSKVRGKNSDSSVDTLSLAIPVAVTRCLQAGLVTLLCWRLLNKLR
ncbi:unnamed protein product, partial [Meganyctiphanes norvegica]